MMHLKNIYLVLFFLPMIGMSQGNTEQFLDEVKEKYTQNASIELNFNIHIVMQEGDTEDISGKLQQKGNKYRLESSLQTVICDGSNAWIYLPSNEEVQIVNADDNTNAMSPSALLQSFNKEEFNMRSVVDGLFTIIELTPIDKEEDIFKIKIKVKNSDKTVIEIAAYEKNGDRYTMTITSQNFNPSLDIGLFVFNEREFPGVYIEDLRID